MPGLGLKNFGSEVLTSNDVDGYLMQQTVMVFASSAARTTAFTSASLSPSEGMVSYLQDTNELFVYNGSTWIELTNVTVEAFTVDSSGRVRLPYQPSFKAYTNGGQINNPANPTYLVFDDVSYGGGHNVGGHYNTSNGIFTAPIAGRYLFSFNMLTNAGNSTNDPGYVKVDIGINNALTHYMAHSHTGTWVMEGSAIILNLAANDQVRMIMTYGSGHYGTYSYFCGCLLG